MGGIPTAHLVEEGWAIPDACADQDTLAHQLVADLHAARPAVFWVDLLASALIGWTAFAVVVAAPQLSLVMLAASMTSGFALYRGLCFTHELTHLRRGSVPGFETAWNWLFGVPLLLPSFTYIGVHQSHHNLSTYGTKDDPEYLPFARSRFLIFVFAANAAIVTPVFLVVRFLLIAPLGLAWPRLHEWLETHASSFSMNPEYRRVVPRPMSSKMRRWELATLAAWTLAAAGIWYGAVPARTVVVWYGVLAFVSALNTFRVLGAHAYESDGTPRDRQGQLVDSIDTPGGPWSELWAPVGLRYHALHHYFPGIPYHNLGAAYRRLIELLPADAAYRESTSPSLPRSLMQLYRRARRASRGT